MTVSFIIATYNGEKYLTKTVESALVQKDVDVEIVIIDDGSSDKSFVIAQNLMKKDRRIKSMKNDSNLGFSRTVNKALKFVSGEFLIILDQDDILYPDHCKNALPYFDDNSVAMVFNNHFLIDGNGTIFDRSIHCLERNLTMSDFIKANRIPVPGLMIRTNILIKAGGYPNLTNYPNYAEYHTWIRIAELGEIIFCKENVALYRRHETNMTNTFEDKKTLKKLSGYYFVCKKQMLSSKKLNVVQKCKLVISMTHDYIKSII